MSNGYPERPEDFELAYKSMTPAWDIGRPQGVFLDLMRSGEINGTVLDVGCGTGEHVLMAAQAGLEAIGIDISPTAISMAEDKANKRGLAAKFLVLSALRLTTLEMQVDTVLDCGLFHNLTGDDRLRFVSGLRAILRPGGHYFMFCMNDQQRRVGAARTISREEIYGSFRVGFHIESIERACIEEKASNSVPAWLSKITRSGTASS
jgi:cyclopropane fatty-acyl-phospholipid synthase-like methyltransferase